jgi:hypothetical protein
MPLQSAKADFVPSLPRFHPTVPQTGDLAPLNAAPSSTVRRWRHLSRREAGATAGLTCLSKRGDDFVTVPFPRIAAAGPDGDRSAAEAVAAYQREGAVVDSRLARKVTLGAKASALADLCSQLRGDTGIQLGAGQSVADEKVTLFCKEMPLRDVMRQLSRPFGYAWLRSGKAGEYKYELTQDLRSQLAEEELRNRDRNAALIALDSEIERYRKYLSLSPEEAEARARTAPPAEKKLLENLGRHGWGAIQMYFRLSRNDLAALRAGQTLAFSAAPKPGEQPLPPDVARGVLQGLRFWRIQRHDDGFGVYGSDEAAEKVPDWLPPAAVPEVRARVQLSINQSELGRFAFTGGPSIFTVGDAERGFNAGGPSGPWAVGVSPSVLQPDNAALNARLARDPALRARVTVRPQPVCRLEPFPGSVGAPGGSQTEGGSPELRVTSADVLEALHRASGLPIVSDYYTRLYKPEVVSPRNLALFDALNQLADMMHLRWNRDKEGGWLQFRSTSFYDDRLKEVPNRLLARWATSRRQRGMLTLDDLAEIAQLSDAQLDAVSMAEGARACFGLVEWELARHEWLRPQLRYLATFTPTQREEAASPAGLPFTRMSLAQQQRYIALALFGDDEPLQSVEELAGAILRVEYTQPGWYRRVVPGENWPQWVVTLEPGRQGRRAARPPVLERTRAAALQAARRQDPQVQEPEIVPTRLSLTFFYMPGTSNRRVIHLAGNDVMIYWSTW